MHIVNPTPITGRQSTDKKRQLEKTEIKEKEQAM